MKIVANLGMFAWMHFFIGTSFVVLLSVTTGEKSGDILPPLVYSKNDWKWEVAIAKPF